MKSRVLHNGLECVRVDDLQHFSLKQIMDSGQCFRIRELPEFKGNGIKMSYSVCWGSRHIRVDEMEQENSFVFHCTDYELWDWLIYFDIWDEYYESVSEILKNNPDPFLEKALEFGSGIRILNQDFFEILISFIISQNNNIKRISKSIEALCEKYGELKEDRGIPYYTFPKWWELISADFSGLGLGYRETYLRELFQDERKSNFAFWLIRVQCAGSYEKAKELLMKVKGIGSKVADCICLYGLHYMEAYPMDTWMKKIASDVYRGYFDITPYKDCAGYVQQLQFYYYRSL